MKNLLLIIFISLQTLFLQAQNTIDISSQQWKIWLDNDARWQNDKLHLPPVNINELPVNKPGCGWNNLYDGRGKNVTLPATVEEHFWNRNNNPYGVAGNYTGVSWFFTEIDIPENWNNKRIVLNFERVQMRAEVFINQKLVGYDIIAGTPFTVDISEAVRTGAKNTLAVRITDPEGNFTWRDYMPQYWGKTQIPSRHGFGGITGKVTLNCTGNSYIKDVFIKNKPEFNEVDLEITFGNKKSTLIAGNLKIDIIDRQTEEIVFRKTENVKVKPNESIHSVTAKVKNAKLWSPENPNLYVAEIRWEDENKENDFIKQTCGFRWFEIKETKGDKQFFLNGRRIVLRSAISWGFWPVNGIYPTNEMAKKQIATAKELGLNMLNFHRGIGQTNVLDCADEMGLLYYEEPGAYGHGNSDFVLEWNRQKLFRMIRRDRNHPSLVIYNMMNEAGRDPKPHEVEDLKKAHQIDETRFITFSSQYYPKKYHNGEAPTTPAQGKIFMKPYDQQTHIQGWWDKHHAGGTGTYPDDYYNSPTDFYRFTNHKQEIIFWGEEGAIGTPPRLELIKNEISKNNAKGWDSHDFQKWYTAYEQFLTNKGFRKAFPNVDDFTKSIGNVSHYYQGRVIENIRAGNITDAYVINGWEETKIENHSGIVDIYRNAKGNTEILSYYNQPLYLAVKARNKVVATGEKVLFDVFIINEKNIKGRYNLQIQAEDEQGVILHKEFPVKISGGNQYGQLLIEGIELEIRSKGYTKIDAVIKTKNTEIKGMEKIFAVNLTPAGNSPAIATIDSAGVIKELLAKTGNFKVVNYTHDETPKENILIVNDLPDNFRNYMANVQQPVLEWVMRGNTMIIITQADEWAMYLRKKEIIEYKGSESAWIHWYGGNFFVKEHPLFKDLPVNTAFNWEYQSLAHYNRKRFGLRLQGEECVAGLQVDHQKELFTAVGIIPLGDGKIIISTPDIQGAILSGDKSAAIAKKLLLNYITFGMK